MTPRLLHEYESMVRHMTRTLRQKPVLPHIDSSYLPCAKHTSFCVMLCLPDLHRSGAWQSSTVYICRIYRAGHMVSEHENGLHRRKGNRCYSAKSCETFKKCGTKHCLISVASGTPPRKLYEEAVLRSVCVTFH